MRGAISARADRGQASAVQVKKTLASHVRVHALTVELTPGCKLPSGRIIPVGESYKKSDCSNCQCVWDDSEKEARLVCAQVLCAKPSCPYPQKVRGQCCPVCPRRRETIVEIEILEYDDVSL